MSYENLDVRDGTEAQVAWNEMIRLPEGAEKNRLINELKKYCSQDTLAMVEIHRILNMDIGKTVKSITVDEEIEEKLIEESETY